MTSNELTAMQRIILISFEFDMKEKTYTEIYKSTWKFYNYFSTRYIDWNAYKA